MSYAHKNEFERIKSEYEAVISLLAFHAKEGQKIKKGRKIRLSGMSLHNPEILEAAAMNANDAYALLLIARAEGFMRVYLNSVNTPLSAEPKLSTLIDKCRKEFNNTKSKIPIHSDIVKALHDLREQR